MTTLNDRLADLRVDCSLAGSIFRAIPLDWYAVLGDIQDLCPSAVIAGGALRDLHFGGEVKDIDIFVPAEESNGLLEVDGWTSSTVIPYGLTYRFGARDEVVAVQEFTVPGMSTPVQVIHLKAPGEAAEASWWFTEFVISRMDFDACRVAFSGTRVHFSPEFEIAARTRTFTLINCEDAIQAKRSLARAARFSERYPGITINTGLAACHIIPPFPEAA